MGLTPQTHGAPVCLSGIRFSQCRNYIAIHNKMFLLRIAVIKEPLCFAKCVACRGTG